ncbi:Swi5-dependent recombination DNA repair protein 1 [Cryptococcus neoformans Bt63]|nr:Swi5-dependent recombination DNA repair protein 1 [Cryptococcus neoformans var. grubii Bt63]
MLSDLTSQSLILWESSPGPPFVSASSTTNISSASLIDLIGPLKRQEKENRTTYATSIDPTYGDDGPSITSRWVINKVFARFLTSHLRVSTRKPCIPVLIPSGNVVRQIHDPFCKGRERLLSKARCVQGVPFSSVGSKKRRRELENPFMAAGTADTASKASTLLDPSAGRYHSMALIKRQRLTVAHVPKPDLPRNRHDTVKPFHSVSHPWPIDQKGDPVYILNRESRRHPCHSLIPSIPASFEIQYPQASAVEYIAQRQFLRTFLPIVNYGYNPNRLITYHSRVTMATDKAAARGEVAVAKSSNYTNPVNGHQVQDPPSIIQPMIVRQLIFPTSHSPSPTIIEDTHHRFMMPEYDNPAIGDYDVMEVRSEYDGELYDMAREHSDANYQTPAQEQKLLARAPKKRPLVNRITLRPRSPSPDVFLSKTQDENSNKHRRSNEDDGISDSCDGQWRVGRIPGHQGCHSTSGRKVTGSDSESGGQKRSLSQSISGQAERVLKKPFRPPTRVTLPKASPKPPVSSLAGDTPDSTSGKTIISTPSTSTSISTLTDSTLNRQAKWTPSRRSTKLTKPFKTPIRSDRSNAPSPSSSSLSSTHRGDQATILTVQNEVMLLKKAVKYDNEDSAGRLEELIIQWRNAGREMVERFFSLIPRPLDDSPLQTSSAYAHNNFSSDWYKGSSTLELTPQQQDYLAKAPLNKDDEPVDTEGNLLFENEEDQDVVKYLQKLGENKVYAVKKSSQMRRTAMNELNVDDYSTCRNAEESSSNEWNYGSLMRGLGVDPPLLGWDACAEDWIDFS